MDGRAGDNRALGRSESAGGSADCSLAAKDGNKRVGELADACGRLLTDTALIFFSFDSVFDWVEVDIYQFNFRILPNIEFGSIHSYRHLC